MGHLVNGWSKSLGGLCTCLKELPTMVGISLGHSSNLPGPYFHAVVLYSDIHLGCICIAL